MDISDQIHAPTALPTGEKTLKPTKMLTLALVRLHSRCEFFGKQKILLLFPDFELQIFQPAA